MKKITKLTNNQIIDFFVKFYVTLHKHIKMIAFLVILFLIAGLLFLTKGLMNSGSYYKDYSSKDTFNNRNLF